MIFFSLITPRYKYRERYFNAGKPLPTCLQSTTHCFGILLGNVSLANRIASNTLARKTFASQYKGRIIPILATKQYGYIYDSDNKGRRFIKKLNKLSRRGYQGLGEVLMWHSGCPNDACPFVRREHSDDRVQSILTVADKHGWPVIAHIEFGSLGSSEYAVLWLV